MVRCCLRSGIMLNTNINRYGNYVLNSQPLRNTLSNQNSARKMKWYYKQLFIKLVYIRRHKINLYKSVEHQINSYFFLSNCDVQKKSFKKNQKRVFFS